LKKQEKELEKYLTKKKHVRIDLNFEKYPVFSSSAFKGMSRIFTREETLPNGDTVEREIIIGKTKGAETGVLRIFDYKVFCALVKIWEEAGRPENKAIIFKINSICKILNIKRGGRNAGIVKESLSQLAKIPIDWKDSFYSKSTGTHESLLNTFRIVDQLKIFERKKKRQKDDKYFGISSFKLNEEIVKNILKKYTKPIDLAEMLKFKKDISILLYRKVDLFLSRGNIAKRTAKGLLEDLDMGKYAFKSRRKQLLEPSLKELKGCRLSTGILKDYRFEETADKKDYCIVLFKEQYNLQIEDSAEAGVLKLSENNYTDPGDDAKQVVDLFIKTFSGLGEDVIKTIDASTAQVLLKKYSKDKIFQTIKRIRRERVSESAVGYLMSILKKGVDLPVSMDELQDEQKKRRVQLEKQKQEQEEQENKKREETEKLEEELLRYYNGLLEDEKVSIQSEQIRIAKIMFSKYDYLDISQKIARIEAIKKYKNSQKTKS
jgi:hypothetical protein